MERVPETARVQGRAPARGQAPEQVRGPGGAGVPVPGCRADRVRRERPAGAMEPVTERAQVPAPGPGRGLVEGLARVREGGWLGRRPGGRHGRGSGCRGGRRCRCGYRDGRGSRRRRGLWCRSWGWVGRGGRSRRGRRAGRGHGSRSGLRCRRGFGLWCGPWCRLWRWRGTHGCDGRRGRRLGVRTSGWLGNGNLWQPQIAGRQDALWAGHCRLERVACRLGCTG